MGIREELEANIENASASIAKSDNTNKKEAINNYVALYKTKIEEDKVGWEARIEDERNTRELELKEKQLDNEIENSRKIKKDTILTCSVVGGVTFVGILIEARGYIMPKISNLFKILK